MKAPLCFLLLAIAHNCYSAPTGFGGIGGLGGFGGVGGAGGDAGEGGLCHGGMPGSPSDPTAPVAPGEAGAIGNTNPQMHIADKTKSKVMLDGEATVEHASHGDALRTSETALTGADDAALGAAEMTNSVTGGVAGTSALSVYAPASGAAHMGAGMASLTANGVDGGMTNGDKI